MSTSLGCPNAKPNGFRVHLLSARTCTNVRFYEVFEKTYWQALEMFVAVVLNLKIEARYQTCSEYDASCNYHQLFHHPSADCDNRTGANKVKSYRSPSVLQSLSSGLLAATNRTSYPASHRYQQITGTSCHASHRHQQIPDTNRTSYPLKFSSLFRAVCVFFKKCLVRSELLDHLSQTIHFYAVCTIFSKFLVPFKQLAPCF